MTSSALPGEVKQAFRTAAQRHFPANGVIPPAVLFRKPQYNTWIELQYRQAQNEILAYAEAVGTWQREGAMAIQGPCEQLVAAPLSDLPWFRRVAMAKQEEGGRI